LADAVGAAAAAVGWSAAGAEVGEADVGGEAAGWSAPAGTSDGDVSAGAVFGVVAGRAAGRFPAPVVALPATALVGTFPGCLVVADGRGPPVDGDPAEMGVPGAGSAGCSGAGGLSTDDGLPPDGGLSCAGEGFDGCDAGGLEASGWFWAGDGPVT
jgi:hypothetical protein